MTTRDAIAATLLGLCACQAHVPPEATPTSVAVNAVPAWESVDPTFKGCEGG